MSVRCPKGIFEGDDVFFSQDYEGPVGNTPEEGERVAIATPFCGRQANFQPKYLYKKTSGTSHLAFINVATIRYVRENSNSLINVIN